MPLVSATFRLIPWPEQMDWLEADVMAPNGSGLTTSVALFWLAAQGPLVIRHLNEKVPEAEGVKIAFGALTLENWLVLLSGPLVMDQVPVPIVGVLADNVVVPPRHIAG